MESSMVFFFRGPTIWAHYDTDAGTAMLNLRWLPAGCHVIGGSRWFSLKQAMTETYIYPIGYPPKV